MTFSFNLAAVLELAVAAATVWAAVPETRTQPIKIWQLGVAPLLTPLLQGSVANPAHMPPRLVARYLAPFVGQEGVNHLLALARAVHEADMEAIDLGAIRASTLVVRGEEDQWLDPEVATRLAVHYTHSLEEKQSQPGTEGIENSQIRLTDGSNIFTANLFGPGITVNEVDYHMSSVDAGIRSQYGLRTGA